jgi:hypothetical protein
VKFPALPRHLTRTLPTAPAQVHGFLLKLWRETPSLLAHEAPPFADYARKVSTKSGEDHRGKANFGWNELE